MLRPQPELRPVVVHTDISYRLKWIIPKTLVDVGLRETGFFLKLPTIEDFLWIVKLAKGWLTEVTPQIENIITKTLKTFSKHLPVPAQISPFHYPPCLFWIKTPHNWAPQRNFRTLQQAFHGGFETFVYLHLSEQRAKKVRWVLVYAMIGRCEKKNLVCTKIKKQDRKIT